MRGATWAGAVGGTIVVTSHDDGTVTGLDPGTGTQRWQRTGIAVEDLRIAGDRMVVATRGTSIEVIGPATGGTVWRVTTTAPTVAVRQDAVYTTTACEPSSGATCTITAYDLRDGHVRWTTPSEGGGVWPDPVGRHLPVAEAAGPYLVAALGWAEPAIAALDAATGRPLPGRSGAGGWATLAAAGPLLVTVDNDPPRNDSRCTVTLSAVDARTGAAAWSGEVFSGRNADDTCVRTLGLRDVQTIFGSGDQIAAVSAHGAPQRFDLATGRTVWVADQTGVPVETDGATMLVRQSAESGRISLLDFATGAPRWTAPDPGLSYLSPSWACAVTSGLVAVTGTLSGGRVVVLVYDVATGRELGRFPGWLAGAGPDWVAVDHSGTTKPVLDLMRFPH